MARTVNKEEYAAKRSEILDATQRLVLSKGYERMTIQDILNDLSMSSGAFYHYFDSKPAVLEAFVERMQAEVQQALLPIVDDPALSAVEKFHRFFTTFDRLRTAHKTTVIEMLHVWYTDDNAIVRQKVDDAVLRQRAPLVTQIVRQGIREQVFTTPFPDEAGEIILSLLHGMGNTHARLMLSIARGEDVEGCVENIVVTHEAYMEAIERVLGAPPNAFYRVDADAVNVWASALRNQ